jgi:hypothetical protein
MGGGEAVKRKNAFKIWRLAQQQLTSPKEPQSFFPRVINKTDITFSKNELTLLNKGPKYFYLNT